MKKYKAPKHIYVKSTKGNVTDVKMFDTFQGMTYHGLENTGMFTEDFDDEALKCNIRSWVKHWTEEN